MGKIRAVYDATLGLGYYVFDLSVLACEQVSSYVKSKFRKEPSAHIEVFQDNKKEYRWRMIAANGKTLAVSSEGYRTKRGVMNALQRIRVSRSGTLVRVSIEEE